MTPEELLEQALEQVESKSIRTWAQSDRNRPIWIKLAEGALEKNPCCDVHGFAAYIVATAIGL
jgi:hypothetical protein